MKWNEDYDDKTISSDMDKYCREFHRGALVAWASHSGNRPKIVEGTVLGFNRHPSLSYTFIRTCKGHITIKKHASQLILIHE